MPYLAIFGFLSDLKRNKEKAIKLLIQLITYTQKL